MKNNRVLRKTYLLIILFLFLFATSTQAWTGRVVGVLDGDTIDVMNAGRAERIRLQGIDCPEKSQPFGSRAKQFTSDLVFGKTVEVQSIEKDRYGRTIGWIFIEGHNVNEAILTAGYAWHYKRYSSDQNLAIAEIAAKEKKIGLWVDQNPIPPWDFRRGTGGKPQSVQYGTIPAGLEKVSSPQKETNFHGNIQSKKFHRHGCQYFDCGNCTAVFKSREDAISAGYVPCKVCSP